MENHQSLKFHHVQHKYEGGPVYTNNWLSFKRTKIPPKKQQMKKITTQDMSRKNAYQTVRNTQVWNELELAFFAQRTSAKKLSPYLL